LGGKKNIAKSCTKRQQALHLAADSLKEYCDEIQATAKHETVKRAYLQTFTLVQAEDYKGAE
jgi:hypothetical protein